MPLLDKLSAMRGEKTNVEASEKLPENVAPVAAAAASKEAPPSYAVTDPISESTGPSEAELNAAFASLNISSTPKEFPDADTCLAHLKLLSAFHGLKEDVGYTDGLFNLWDARCEMVENRDETLAKMREKRWALYIARAVERFEEWWLKVLVNMEPSKRLEGKEMVATNADFVSFTSRGRPQQWTAAMLPPIDVLMVWHSFMLNPRNYEEDCVRFGLKDLWATGMPWIAVNAAIDTSFHYNVPEEAKTKFTQATRRHWNNAEDSLMKMVHCPRCSQQLDIPWTTCCQSEKTPAKEVADMNGQGFGDRDLSFFCLKCGSEVNHDLLRVTKFKKDTENLIMRDWPLGGTILSPEIGAPVAPTTIEWNTYPYTFPNRLVGLELRAQVIELVNNGNPTMNDIKELIEGAIKDKSVVKKVNSKSVFESGVLKRQERLAIRKMMSRYWENPSIFALELGGAVIRQSVFVDKMYQIDWLHSPAARQTMDRLLQKYSRFIHIIATYPSNTAVPTLDVDLGWHTHQLSTKSYFDYTMVKCKKYIDHDDKMDEDALSSGFEWTSKTYEKLFNEVYSECTCWYCEAIRSKHISRSNKIFGTSKHEKVLNNFYDSGAAKLCPPDNSAHISSHNAVKVVESEARTAVYAALRRRRELELEEAYKKACKRAQAKGRPIPPRQDYYYGAWGYPYLMYGPWMSYGMMGGVYYAGDPCVMPMGAGMAGNCAAGTCSGGVGAGGCG
ncbi:uncharacterized protein LY89DRAFT_605468 [Mollisia scopiformis]|uniref:Uncharacterized protein n=1 Tax=Mollisia scopiformis TaxID=149040 RepID=A0A194XWY6_MOLSC|nr:uncharacterized protein LY89DRAFT_605468 [Mollisia scopiformis]KUJ24676.1 hypothetical protein LY89DRAFT_605468 [Mollisia scopiformis]